MLIKFVIEARFFFYNRSKRRRLLTPNRVVLVVCMISGRSSKYPLYSTTTVATGVAGKTSLEFKQKSTEMMESRMARISAPPKIKKRNELRNESTSNQHLFSNRDE